MTGRAVAPDLGDDRQHDVLGADSGRGLAVHRNCACAWAGAARSFASSAHAPLPRRQYRKQKAKRAVGSRCGCRRRDQQAGSVKPCSGPTTCTMPCRRSLRPNNAIRCLAAFSSSWRTMRAFQDSRFLVARRSRRHVVIRHTECETGSRNRHTGSASRLKAWKGAFMHVMAIHPQQRIAVLAAHDLVRGPKAYRVRVWASVMRTPREVEGKPI